METLLQRDGKEAIYKRALASELRGVAGVDLPYEPPAHPELVVRTDQETVDDALTRVFQALVDGKFIGPTEFGRLTGGLAEAEGKPGKAAKPAAAKAAARRSRGRGQGRQGAGGPRRPAEPRRQSPPSRPPRRARRPKKSAARTARR